MNKPRQNVVCILCMLLGVWAPALAQTSPVTLSSLLENAAAIHPTLLGARAEVRAGEFDIEAASRRKWPTVSAVAESRSSGTGTSANQPQRLIQIEQILWDGGLRNAGIAQATAGMKRSTERVELQKQLLFVQVVNGWQTLLAARDRSQIAKLSLERLRVYEGQMQRRVAASASSQIDLELVSSRIRQTEVELLAAASAATSASTRLAQLTGVSGLVNQLDSLPALPPPAALAPLRAEISSADLQEVAADSASVRVARRDAESLRAQLDGKQAERWPTVYVRGAKPLGSTNGLPSDASLFIGLRYTPGAGLSTLSEGQALEARVAAVDQAIDAATRDVVDQLSTNREEFQSAERRLSPLEAAVVGSDQVLESYSRQFTAGRKTWLDLLNAARELAQNRYALADSRAAMAGAAYRLQIRMGRYPVLP